MILTWAEIEQQSKKDQNHTPQCHEECECRDVVKNWKRLNRITVEELLRPSKMTEKCD